MIPLSLLRNPTALALPAFAIVIIALCVQTVRLDGAIAAKAKAEARLVNPMTGKKWSEEAAWSAAEAKALRIAIERQNLDLDALRVSSEGKIAESQKTASAAISQAAVAQRAAADLLARKPKGETTCERAVDQQRAFLEKLP